MRELTEEQLLPDQDPPVTFEEEVEIQLDIEIAGTTYSVVGQRVTALALALSRYGLRGSLDVWLPAEEPGSAPDPLRLALAKSDLATVTLQLRPVWPKVKDGDTATRVQVQGLVFAKRLSAHAYYSEQGMAQASRCYRLHFCDSARLLWGQHHPCELYTQKSMQEVLEAHKGDRIQLAYQTQALSAKQEQIFVGLDATTRDAASFYDFLLWYVDRQQLQLFYDFAQSRYTIADEPPSPPSPIPLSPKVVASANELAGAVPRFKTRVLNACTEDSRVLIAEQEQATAPLCRDLLVCTSIAAQADDCLSRERKRQLLPEPRLRLEFQALPEQLFRPGETLDLRSEAWWQNAHLSIPRALPTELHRVTAVELRLRSLQPAHTQSQRFGSYDRYTCTLTAEAEPVSQPRPPLPAYTAPVYPRYVEGRIVSEQGADDEETYDFETDQQKALDRYKVKIPLWNNQQVRAPYLPGFLSGHFYVPAYKNQRVLVALDLDGARLAGFLDWRSEARLPKESQGEHLLLGKKPASSASLSLVYTDQQPVFTIKRTEQKDVQTLQIRQGHLMLEVREEQ